MSIRKIKRYVKVLLLLSGLVTVGVKGKDYLPSFNNDTTPVYRSEKPTASPEHTLEGCLPVTTRSLKEQLLYRKNYVVSYNSDTKCPNWVFWQLTREHADGNVKRPDYAFHEDMEVPAPRAELADYKGSGYDRGHMCPAGDNKWDADAMYESFLMTNMCPQNQNLNSGLWNQIEMQCRYWAKKHGSLYIVCGPIFLNEEHQTIGGNKVMVPEAFFKVILCMEGTPKGIAFICRNTDGNRKKDYYVNTISQVERITGYTFFPFLDDDTADAIKEHADLKNW